MTQDGERVVQAVADARAESQRAYGNYAETAPRTPEGHIRDAAGIVSIQADCTRKLKRILLEHDLAVPSRGLKLILRGMTPHEQAITGQEVGAGAAIEVLNRELGDLGKFHILSRLD